MSSRSDGGMICRKLHSCGKSRVYALAELPGASRTPFGKSTSASSSLPATIPVIVTDMGKSLVIPRVTIRIPIP